MATLAEPEPRVLTIRQALDFKRVLTSSSAARTSHFAIHHVAESPARRNLSTVHVGSREVPVESAAPEAVWLGLVVPKRHAKRSVTRNLIKRQIRAAVSRRGALPHGLWVVRLSSPFDRKLYPSAASSSLAKTARAELDALLAKVAPREPLSAGLPC